MKDIIKQATIVDVRTAEEYAGEHYPGAVNIPLHEIPARIEEFRQMKHPIVAYCRSGGRSAMAVSILKQNGLKEAYDGGGLFVILQSKN